MLRGAGVLRRRRDRHRRGGRARRSRLPDDDPNVLDLSTSSPVSGQLDDLRAMPTVPGDQRVLVVGDSMSWSVFDGLDAVGRDPRRAVRPLLGPRLRRSAGPGPSTISGWCGSRSPTAGDWHRDLGTAVEAFRPDTVLVVGGLADVSPRKFADGEFHSIGDPVYDARLTRRVQRVRPHAHVDRRAAPVGDVPARRHPVQLTVGPATRRSWRTTRSAWTSSTRSSRRRSPTSPTRRWSTSRGTPVNRPGGELDPDFRPDGAHLTRARSGDRPRCAPPARAAAGALTTPRRRRAAHRRRRVPRGARRLLGDRRRVQHRGARDVVAAARSPAPDRRPVRVRWRCSTSSRRCSTCSSRWWSAGVRCPAALTYQLAVPRVRAGAARDAAGAARGARLLGDGRHDRHRRRRARSGAAQLREHRHLRAPGGDAARRLGLVLRRGTPRYAIHRLPPRLRRRDHRRRADALRCSIRCGSSAVVVLVVAAVRPRRAGARSRAAAALPGRPRRWLDRQEPGALRRARDEQHPRGATSPAA